MCERKLRRAMQSYNFPMLTKVRDQMSLIVRKHVFGVSDKASFKPVSSATEASPVASLHIIYLRNKETQQTKI